MGWLRWGRPFSPPAAKEEISANPQPRGEEAGASRRAGRPIVEPAAPANPPAPAETETRSLDDLERAFLAANDTEVQLETAGEMAGFQNEAAVQALVRVFPRARHPEVKEGVLAALGDIAPEIEPFERIALLQRALFGQPRNVRLTALDGLSHFDDPRARTALQRAAREDPDQLIREAAAAFAGAVEEGEQ